MSDPLERLAQRAEEVPFFLASLLAVYARSEKLDDAGLAAALGCTPEALTSLRLCRAPAEERGRFRKDVEQIAAHCGADPVRLAGALRQAQALQARRPPLAAGADASPADTPGLLMAARDAPPEGPEDEPPTEEQP